MLPRKLTIEIVLQYNAQRNNLTRDYNTIKIQVKQDNN